MPQPYNDILVVSIGILIMTVIAVAALRLTPFIYDYRFSHRRVDVVMFGGRIVIWSIDNISNARLLNTFNLFGWLRYFPWLSIALPNRIRLHWLVVRDGWWTIFITPADPRAAMEILTREDNAQRP